MEDLDKVPEGVQSQRRLEPDMSLLGVVPRGCDGIDLVSVLKNKHGQDAFFKTIVENPKH